MSRLDNLTAAVRTALRNKCVRSQISVPAWAQTYRVSQREVREIWEHELTKDTNAIPGGDE